MANCTISLFSTWESWYLELQKFMTLLASESLVDMFFLVNTFHHHVLNDLLRDRQ